MLVEREFSTSYIYLDIAFLVFFVVMLIIKKKYLGLLFSLFGGILYFIVDYGIFHLALGSRAIENGDMFLTLLWMSISYGLTNFAIIYLFISKDKDFLLYSLFIWIWWLVAPQINSIFDSGANKIHISRTTGEYHGAMAILLLVGYFGLIIYNILIKDKNCKAPILKLFLIGFIVQFGWELGLLLGGIRSTSMDNLGDKLLLLLQNSLLETNLGMPYLWLIVLSLRRVITEELKLVPKENRKTLKEEISLNNSIRYIELIKRSAC